MGRPIARHLPAAACAPAITEHFAWRADGQLTSFANPTAEVRFAFDAAGRVLRESQSHTDQSADPWHYACTHLHGLRVDGIEIEYEGIKSVQATFPESKCDTKCLRAQLDAYYKSKCSGPMPAKSGAGNRGDSRTTRKEK